MVQNYRVLRIRSRSATARIQIFVHQTGSELGAAGHFLGGITDRISSFLSYSDEPAQQPKGGNDEDDDEDDDEDKTIHSNGWNSTQPPFLPLEAQQDFFLHSSSITAGLAFSCLLAPSNSSSLLETRNT
jgi:hypothetical protein